ncbi:MAG: HepT-like ribonuclease domain-containing protein [Desulfobacterales bacterium]
MRKDNLIHIRHMLEAAEDAISFARNRTRRDLDDDRMFTLSIVKSVELIGEAASKISKEGKDAHPEIPWSDIVAMRNRLIHVYFDIDLDRVWDTVTDDLPPLVYALKKILEYEE